MKSRLTRPPPPRTPARASAPPRRSDRARARRSRSERSAIAQPISPKMTQNWPQLDVHLVHERDAERDHDEERRRVDPRPDPGAHPPERCERVALLAALEHDAERRQRDVSPDPDEGGDHMDGEVDLERERRERQKQDRAHEQEQPGEERVDAEPAEQLGRGLGSSHGGLHRVRINRASCGRDQQMKPAGTESVKLPRQMTQTMLAAVLPAPGMPLEVERDSRSRGPGGARSSSRWQPAASAIRISM